MPEETDLQDLQEEFTNNLQEGDTKVPEDTDLQDLQEEAQGLNIINAREEVKTPPTRTNPW